MAVQQGKVAQRKKPSSFFQAFQRIANRMIGFIMNYFAVMFAVMLGLLLVAAVLSPILSYLGLDIIARPIFYTMHVICAQTPSHSFYIFGHQLCLCERCLAIYSAMFFSSLFFLVRQRRMPGLRFWQLALLSVPMALDGFTQMFGLRESNWELRLFTGALFGIAVIWFTLPLVEKIFEEERMLARAFRE
jgi:uncharacterized membrane protein